MGNRLCTKTRTAIPASPGPTSSNQLSLPAGGSITVAIHTPVTTDKSIRGMRKYDEGAAVMVFSRKTRSCDGLATSVSDAFPDELMPIQGEDQGILPREWRSIPAAADPVGTVVIHLYFTLCRIHTFGS